MILSQCGKAALRHPKSHFIRFVFADLVVRIF